MLPFHIIASFHQIFLFQEIHSIFDLKFFNHETGETEVLVDGKELSPATKTVLSSPENSAD